MTTTSESDPRRAAYERYLDAKRPERTDAEIDASWGLSDDMTPEQRRARIRELADEHEIEEDPRASERAMLELRALRDEEMFASELSKSSFVALPTAVRRLYRQNPNNPRIRALYDQVMQELYERADDTLRAALLPAVDKMVDLMDCGDAKTEFRAATYVFERLRGKTPDVLTVSQDKPFQVILERVTAGPRMLAPAPTADDAATEPLEAEIVAETISGPRTADGLYVEEEALAEMWNDLLD